ncbi:fructosamine kinase family protein [Oceaniglobus roseus]|uniref:fructosamine kinase family protein n=1 Tax=Oceaniglobus roseus TaxID=1737570 RepID=UPI000C7F4C59|nr:fructosamine kinase family protein [Kandeliimicrobium roseum]
MSGVGPAVAALLGAGAAGVRALSGGDLSEVARVALEDGRSVIAKRGATAPAEAAMLDAIRGAGVPAPQVLGVAEDLLVLEDLGADEGPGAAWGDLGHVVRRLHGVRGARYGWPEDHAFGTVTIPNAPCDDWPGFWAERRLLPFCDHVPADLARRIGALAARLPDLLPRDPGPALLHGDLWAGNVMARGGKVTGLIDPACYHGDPEVDLAMLCLFARPSPAFWEAYGPLAPGAEERRAIYRLWPALVHLRLFGGGYRGMVEGCLDAAG